MPEYQGVNVEHPSIARATKNMIMSGKSDEEIRKVVGIPQEVVDRYKNDVKREMSK